MALRSTILTFLALAGIATAASFFFPWHQTADAAEWDDGEHIWGRNIHSHSLFVSDLGTEVEEDADGVLLRQAGFWAFTGGLFLASVAFVFAVFDRKAWTLSLDWVAFVALVAGSAGMVGGLMYELSDVSDLAPGIGLFLAAAAIVNQLVGTILASWLGRTEPAQARKEHRLARKEARREAKLAQQAEVQAEGTIA